MSVSMSLAALKNKLLTLPGKAHRHWAIVFSALVIIAFISFVGAIFYVRGRVLMQNEIKDKLKNIATVATNQFDGDVINSIRTPADEKTAAFKDTIARLNTIRQEVSGIRFAYIMRRGQKPDTLIFVADADKALSAQQLDVNGNGIVDATERPADIGEPYDISASPNMLDAFVHPTVDRDVSSDAWGSIISAYAPIRAKSGIATAILGIDMDASEYRAQQNSIFSPLALFLMLIAGSMMASFTFVYMTRSQLEDLRRLDSERSGLLRLTFHQLGGPLTILNWAVEVLKDQTDPEAIQKQLVNMEEGMTRLSNILNSLREANQIHEGTIEYRPEFSSLTDIITRVAKEYELRLRRSRQNVVLSLHSDLKMKLDKKLITAVMRELLGNAMDFSPPGNTITIRTSQTLNFVQVEVHDRGFGIPTDDKKKIFQQFMRGTNATKYKPDGSGLGLYIVKGIIDRGGGKIWIESRENHGTSVFFRLPKI